MRIDHQYEDHKKKHHHHWKLIFIILIIGVAVIGLGYALKQGAKTILTTINQDTVFNNQVISNTNAAGVIINSELVNTNSQMPDNNVNQKPGNITPDYVSSNPASGSTISTVPSKVSMTFASALNDLSELQVVGENNNDITVSTTELSDDKMSMSVPVDPASAKGTYIVKYNACFLDGTCKKGKYTYYVK